MSSIASNILVMTAWTKRNSSKLPTQINFLSVFGILLNIFEVRILPLQGFFLELQFSGNLYFRQLWKIDLRAPAPGISLMCFVDSGYLSPPCKTPCFFFECGCSNSKLIRFFFKHGPCLRKLVEEHQFVDTPGFKPRTVASNPSVTSIALEHLKRAPKGSDERVCI